MVSTYCDTKKKYLFFLRSTPGGVCTPTALYYKRVNIQIITCSKYLFDSGFVNGGRKLHHIIIDFLVSHPGVIARLGMQFYKPSPHRFVVSCLFTTVYIFSTKLLYYYYIYLSCLLY